MDDSRLAKQIYIQRRTQPNRRVNDWCSHIQKILKELKIEHVWFSEQVGTEKDWKTVVKACIQGREQKLWIREMNKKDKLRLYKTIKLSLKREEYLDVIMDLEERRLVTALRGGNNQLRIEVGRWKNEEIHERTCSICASGEPEDEVHALFECSAYLRERRDWFSNIRKMTRYDFMRMKDDTEWLTHMVIGVGCMERRERNTIQQETAKFIWTLFRKRTYILS